MKQYAKIISESQIEFAPRNFKGISNWGFNADLVKKAGYLEYVEPKQVDNPAKYNLIYKEINNKVQGFYVEKENYFEELKQAKKAWINQARDNAEQGGFLYLGKMFDSDPVSCQRISCASQTFAMADDTATIVWTCQDNTKIELNKPQVMGLVVALTMWSNTCHQKASKLKELVSAATSAEEVEAINWDMELPEEVVEEPTVEEGSEDLVELYSMEI